MGDGEEEPQYTLILPDGKRKEDGSIHYSGYAKATYATGDSYDGTYVEGQRAGSGVYVHKANGDSFVGHYQSNKKHGFGKMTYTAKSGLDDGEGGEEPEDDGKVPRGGVYLGYFSEGKRGLQEKDDPEETRSDGTFTYANKDVYTGQWRAGKKHGAGTYCYAGDGTKLVGTWEAGKMSSGKWVFPNGTFYTGKFRYNKPFGKGVWVLPSGNQLAGIYNQREKPSEEGEVPEAAEGEEPPPRPDPQVYCNFTPGRNQSVTTSSVPYPKPACTA